MDSTTFAGVGTILCRDARRYRILARLAEGRHGPICTVRDAYGKKCVAKCFRATPSDAAAFRREASALDALRHPNIVYLFDTVSHENANWLILEACNMNLGGWLKQVGRDAARHFPAIASGMLEALDYVHRRGFLHGDVRPRNILLVTPGKARPTVSPTIKLTDFGESSALGTGAAGNGPRFSGGWIFPPEVLNTGRVWGIDHRADLFLCALVLLSVLRGNVINLTQDEVMAGKALVLLREIDEEWAPPLGRALDPVPANRHPSALALWEDLWRVMQKLNIAA